jgi:hypothetical protein
MDAPDTLYAMMIAPDEEWDAQNTRGKEIGKGLPENVLASMGKAFTMARGSIPKASFNAAVLNLPLDPAAPTEPSKAMQNGNRTPIPQNPSIARAAKSDPLRPKRNVKKRTYGDSSFEGYGEGYVDDDAQETGYSTGEGDDRGGSRKRPKKVGILLQYCSTWLTMRRLRKVTASKVLPCVKIVTVPAWSELDSG